MRIGADTIDWLRGQRRDSAASTAATHLAQSFRPAQSYCSSNRRADTETEAGDDDPADRLFIGNLWSAWRRDGVGLAFWATGGFKRCADAHWNYMGCHALQGAKAENGAGSGTDDAIALSTNAHAVSTGRAVQLAATNSTTHPTNCPTTATAGLPTASCAIASTHQPIERAGQPR